MKKILITGAGSYIGTSFEKYIKENYGNMVSAQRLLKEIWGYEPDDSVETIRVHIRHLRTKIDKISGDKKYIETIYGGGYKLNI